MAHVSQLNFKLRATDIGALSLTTNVGRERLEYRL
jgi:hypothetical protein